MFPQNLEVYTLLHVEIFSSLHGLISSQGAQNLYALTVWLNFICERLGFIMLHTEITGIYDLLEQVWAIFLTDG